MGELHRETSSFTVSYTQEDDWIKTTTNIRWQSNPFPVNPVRQVQIASPLVLTQVACGWQGLGVQGSGGGRAKIKNIIFPVNFLYPMVGYFKQKYYFFPHFHI